MELNAENPKIIDLDPKTQQIATKLYPIILELLKSEGWVGDAAYENFLDRLKNEESLGGAIEHKEQRNQKATKTTKKDIERKASMFMPEIDYFVALAMRRGLLMECGYDNAGNIRTPRHPTKSEKQLLESGSAHGMLGYAVKGVALGDSSAVPQRRHDIIIPSSTLKVDVADPYLCRYDSDFRIVSAARTTYMPGIIDRKVADRRNNRLTQLLTEGGKTEDAIRQAAHEFPDAGNNRSARTIIWEHPEANTDAYWTNIMVPMIDATREYWHKYVPDDGGSRIVTKATMMEILDKFESGELKPGKIDWYVTTLVRSADFTSVTEEQVPLSEVAFNQLSLFTQPSKISLGTW